MKKNKEKKPNFSKVTSLTYLCIGRGWGNYRRDALTIMETREENGYGEEKSIHDDSKWSMSP